MKTAARPTILTDVLLAFVLLSRLPLPRLPEEAFENAARAVWCYPIVGAALGGMATSVGAIAIAVGLPPALAAGLLLAVLAFSTGALHEDGLADVADGFWGGFTPERRLEIMKDSQIGTYGTLALILTIGLRWGAIAALITIAPLAIIASAALSRAAMTLLMCSLPPARASGLSHSVGRPDLVAMLSALGLALVFSFALIGAETLAAIVAVLIVSAGMHGLARAKIDGQTGDVLGATQQLTETVMLCVLVALMAK